MHGWDVIMGNSTPRLSAISRNNQPTSYYVYRLRI